MRSIDPTSSQREHAAVLRQGPKRGRADSQVREATVGPDLETARDHELYVGLPVISKQLEITNCMLGYPCRLRPRSRWNGHPDSAISFHRLAGDQHTPRGYGCQDKVGGRGLPIRGAALGGVPSARGVVAMKVIAVVGGNGAQGSGLVRAIKGLWVVAPRRTPPSRNTRPTRAGRAPQRIPCCGPRPAARTPAHPVRERGPCPSGTDA